MDNKADWCIDKLTKLLVDELRVSTLTEIKEHFQEISNAEAILTAQMLELPLVFDCLNNNNKEQIDLACEVLSICMEKLEISEATVRYTIPLERALTHPNTGVKVMALKVMSRIMKLELAAKRQMIFELCQRPLFANTIRCIGDDKTRVATAASKIIAHFANVDSDCVVSDTSLRLIREVMSKSSCVRLRFYELFVDVCVVNKNTHDKIISNGLLNQMFEEISSTDILLRLNIIEILYRLVECDYGCDYLRSEGYIDEIYKQFADNSDPIFSQLCEPGILKFFGHMAHCKPHDVFTIYPQVIEHMFENLNKSDFTIFKVSLETLGYISTGDKIVMDSFVGSKICTAISNLAERLPTLPSKYKIQVLEWMEELLKSATNEMECEITFKWYSAFGPNPVEIIMHYVRTPFEELRLAGFGILHSMSRHKWGHEVINNHTGLVEFLLDRQAESLKAAKDMKYEILDNLYNRNFNVFNNQTLAQVGTYLQEGPHYVAVDAEVAVEGNE